MKNPRRLTLDETDDSIGDWTADSRAVLFVSYRNGMETSSNRILARRMRKRSLPPQKRSGIPISAQIGLSFCTWFQKSVTNRQSG